MCKGLKNIFCGNQKTPADYIYEWAKALDAEIKRLSEDVTILTTLVTGEPIDLETLLASKADAVHTHEMTDVTGLSAALGNLAPAEHTHYLIAKSGAAGRAMVDIDIDEESGGEIGLSTKVGNQEWKNALINSANIDNLNRALETPSTTPVEDSNNLITSGAVYDATRPIEHFSTVVPLLSAADEGDEFMYVGNSTVKYQFGQTYQCQTKRKASCALIDDSQDGQEKSDVLNYVKTLRTVSGYGKYIMTGYNQEGSVLTIYIDTYPNSASTDMSDFYAAIITDINSEVARAVLDIDDHISEYSSSYKKEWVAKYHQDIVPMYYVDD